MKNWKAETLTKKPSDLQKAVDYIRPDHVWKTGNCFPILYFFNHSFYLFSHSFYLSSQNVHGKRTKNPGEQSLSWWLRKRSHPWSFIQTNLRKQMRLWSKDSRLSRPLELRALWGDGTSYFDHTPIRQNISQGQFYPSCVLLHSRQGIHSVVLYHPTTHQSPLYSGMIVLRP